MNICPLLRDCLLLPQDLFLSQKIAVHPVSPHIFHRSNLKMVPKYTVRVRLLAAATIKLFQVPIMGRVQK